MWANLGIIPYTAPKDTYSLIYLKFKIKLDPKGLYVPRASPVLKPKTDPKDNMILKKN